MAMALKNRRELILRRLVEIASSLQGVESVWRNSDTIPKDARPAILINDGDEFSSEADRAAQLQKSGIFITVMAPEITIFSTGATVEMERPLSDISVALVSAIWGDSTINSLTGTNGSFRYNGCATMDSFGQRLEGEMKVNLEFTYPFMVGETV